MRLKILISIIAAATLLLCLALRPIEINKTPPSISYRGGIEGKVMFSHKQHASEGIRCNDCHTDYNGTDKQLFTTRKQGLITIEDHGNEVKCFACHNGKGISENNAAGSFLEKWDVFDDCRRCHYPNSSPVAAAQSSGGIHR